MSTTVTVIGAGLGGLTLARILQRNGIGVVVYDLDAGPDARPQGGMLDMHEESGQAALRAAGLYDAFRAHVLPGGRRSASSTGTAGRIWSRRTTATAAARRSPGRTCAGCCSTRWPRAPRGGAASSSPSAGVDGTS
jgi:2-polyprenyl-6-methoxyphenol hydroxylase-like FAD-dependent oxidoreductase